MTRLRWPKYSFSEPGSDTCVELAAAPAGGRTHLRESDTPAEVIATTGPALRALLHGIKEGHFNQASR